MALFDKWHWMLLGGIACSLLGAVCGYRNEEIQSNEAKRHRDALKAEAATVDNALDLANGKLADFQRALGVTDLEKETSSVGRQSAALDQTSESLRIQLDTLDLQTSDLLKEISKYHPALVSVRQELNLALMRYTEEHPRVKKLRATLDLLQAQIAERNEPLTPDALAEGSLLAQSLSAKLIELRAQQVGLIKQLEGTIISRSLLQAKLKRLSESSTQYAALRSDCETLKIARRALTQRQNEERFLEDRAAAPSRLFEAVLPGESGGSPKILAAGRYGLRAGMLGVCLAGLAIFGIEVTNRRIRSESDLRRATDLPVLGSLGDLRQMSQEDRDHWAFTTLMALKGRLTHSGSQALVCGFISSTHGQGCSTWVELLAQAAKRCGYQVLTISTSHSLPQLSGAPQPGEQAGNLEGRDWMPAPLEITSALMSPNLESTLELPLSRWVWDVENRQRWQAAVRRWKTMENAAVFMDLPPASHPEAVLLSEELSSLIWLCGKDMADISDTQSQLETLRHVRSDLAGVVFNRASSPAWKKRFCHLVPVAFALALFSSSLAAQEAGPQPEAPVPVNARISPAFSVSSPAQLAGWQKRFTLGAGDVLNVSLYEQPDSERRGLIIGPDGRLNYLQARDVVASGLTIEELRAEFEKVLAKYYRPPLRVIIVPQAYHSKKYYLLGNVVQKGVFPLDRPVTILEAIAQAQGFVTTTERRSTLVLADLPRAFLIRKGEGEEHQRVKVDFEALFLQGDLNQNIPLAPGDYLYFPPLDLQEVYVMGEVGHPGITTYTPEMTALRAITSRGGFGERAFRQRVLIVRGSLNHPQTLVLNVSDILKARAVDVKLEPRDIVYVSRRPWYKAEELLEAAVSDFLRTVVVTWTGKNVQVFFK